MLKYQNILDGLTIEQKIAVLADASQLSKGYARVAGAPYLKVCRFDDAVKSAGLPSFNALLCGWGKNYVSAYGQVLANAMKQSGANVTVLPNACVKNSPYSKNGTEDPALLSETLKSMATALKENGVNGVYGFNGLNNEELNFADLSPDETALNDYYFKAINELLKTPSVAVAFTKNELSGEYKKIDKIKEIKQLAATRDDAYAISMDSSEGDFDFDFPVNFGGNAQSVDDAYKNYIYLENEIENGALGTDGLNEAVKDGLAISEDMINVAVDKLLDFAYGFIGKDRAVEPQPEAADYDDLLKRISLSLPVLLKNQNGALPLKSGANVAIVGDVAAYGFTCGTSFIETVKERGATANGVVFGGYARGYDLGFDRSDDLEDEAVALAGRSDAILYFVGLGQSREERISSACVSRLPSNQAALLAKLKKLGKPVIAVIVGEFMPDGDFIDDVQAALFAPSSGKYAAFAALETVTGKSNPSGRLPYTVYVGGDERFYELRSDILNGRNKQGAYVGYRNYLTEGVKVKYPFGFGLSYSRFEYGGLKISGKTLDFHVKNSSKTVGEEVAQIYICKNDSAALRPVKELKAFVKIRLNGGERRKISVALNNGDFACYNVQSKQYDAEKGMYLVTVGAFAGDTKLAGNIYSDGVKFKNDLKKVDYLQSETNIVEGGYRLKTNDNKTNSHKKAMTAFKTGLIIAAVIIAAIVAVEILNRLDVIDFDLFLKSVVGLYVQIIIGAALIILLITFAVMYKTSKNKYLNGGAKKTESVNIEDGYEDVSDKSESLYDKLFAVEFAEVSEDSFEQAAEDGVDEDLSRYYERGLTLTGCVKRLFAYIQNRGLDIGEGDVKKFISAMGSSRLIVLKANDEVLLGEFIKIVSEFFFGQEYVDVIDGTFAGKNDLFAPGGNPSLKRNVALAVANAAANKEKICFSTLKNVRLSKMSDYFVDLIQYFVNPSHDYVLQVSDNFELTVTPNFRAFIVPRADDDGELPQFLKDVQETVVLSLRRNGVSANVEAFPPSSYQFETLVEKARNAYTVSEDLWKKVDKLDAEFTKRIGFNIRNKAWTSLEKETSVYLAVGGEQNEAVDFAVAAKLILPAARSFRANPQPDSVTLTAILEDVFGDENVAESKKIIRADIPVRVVETQPSKTAASNGLGAGENVPVATPIDNSAKTEA